MGFKRALVSDTGKLPQPLRAGDGFIANPSVHDIAADAAAVLTTAQLSGGFITNTTTLTADRAVTTPTAALIAAEFPSMDVGDSFPFFVANRQAGAFDLIVAGGTGVTLKGAGNVVQQAGCMFVLVKTAAATFDLY
jgi:hypothetical protein